MIFLTNEEKNEAYSNAYSNNNIREAINEKIGDKISLYIPGCTLEEAPSNPDVKIRLDGIPSPRVVKAIDETGMSIEERKEAFLNALKYDKDAAIKKIMDKFEKEVFKNSKAGIAIIIGFDKNKIDPNSEYVEIDVLIVKVYRNEELETIFVPNWLEGEL
jgi:hypothetical protein